LERKALDLTPAGKREVGDPAGEAEVGFFTRVKITFLSALTVFFHESENNLPFLSAESKCQERKSTVKFGCTNYI
jgi:hypothetical protein